MAKYCPKCNGYMDYNPFLRVDTCESCGYMVKRPDKVMFELTVKQVAFLINANNLLVSGNLKNDIVNKALELQTTENISVYDASSKAISEVMQ